VNQRETVKVKRKTKRVIWLSGWRITG
jgi:ribosome modulation factor